MRWCLLAPSCSDVTGSAEEVRRNGRSQRTRTGDEGVGGDDGEAASQEESYWKEVKGL